MKKIKVISVMLLLLGALLINISMAEPYGIRLGPYIVSFDMGQPLSAYNITVEPTKEIKEEPPHTRDIFYLINIQNNSSDLMKSVESGTLLDSVFIQIVNVIFDPTYVSGESVMGSGESNIRDLKNMLQEKDYNLNIKMDKLLIDGQDGAILSYEHKLAQNFTEKIFEAAYRSSIDNNTLVMIYSTYPWDEGTSQLLRTIHIETEASIEKMQKMVDADIKNATPKMTIS
jgi:hypothetical protein